MVIPVCVALLRDQRAQHSEFTPLLYITLDKISVEILHSMYASGSCSMTTVE